MTLGHAQHQLQHPAAVVGRDRVDAHVGLGEDVAEPRGHPVLPVEQGAEVRHAGAAEDAGRVGEALEPRDGVEHLGDGHAPAPSEVQAREVPPPRGARPEGAAVELPSDLADVGSQVHRALVLRKPLQKRPGQDPHVRLDRGPVERVDERPRHAHLAQAQDAHLAPRAAPEVAREGAVEPVVGHRVVAVEGEQLGGQVARERERQARVEPRRDRQVEVEARRQMAQGVLDEARDLLGGRRHADRPQALPRPESPHFPVLQPQPGVGGEQVEVSPAGVEARVAELERQSGHGLRLARVAGDELGVRGHQRRFPGVAMDLLRAGGVGDDVGAPAHAVEQHMAPRHGVERAQHGVLGAAKGLGQAGQDGVGPVLGPIGVQDDPEAGHLHRPSEHAPRRARRGEGQARVVPHGPAAEPPADPARGDPRGGHGAHEVAARVEQAIVVLRLLRRDGGRGRRRAGRRRVGAHPRPPPRTPASRSRARWRP